MELLQILSEIQNYKFLPKQELRVPQYQKIITPWCPIYQEPKDNSVVKLISGAKIDLAQSVQISSILM